MNLSRIMKMSLVPCLALLSSSVASAQNVAKSFAPSTIAVGGLSTLTFTVTNPHGVALTGLNFSDTLPAGLQVATPLTVVGNCGGVVTAAGSLITLSGGTLAAGPGTTCTFSVQIGATTAGVKVNTTTCPNSVETGVCNQTGPTPATPGTATITVVGPLGITKAFGPSAIQTGGTATLTVTITNSNAVAVSGVAFTDTLPAGLLISSPSGVANGCGGTLVANASTNAINLSAVTLAANASCTITLNVTGTASGVLTNTTGAITATGPVATTGGTGSASITVVAPPTLTKAFGTGPIQTGGTTTLTFVITNSNTFAVTGVGFTDTLPAGLILGSPAFVSAVGCASGAILVANPGTNTISVSNLTQPANSTCTVTLNVTGVAGGIQTNTTGVITATGPAATTGGTASAVITVIPSDVFQIKYFTLQFGGGVLNVTNVGSFFGGASTVPPLDQATDPNGTLCANFYAFDPNEEMVACCACKVTPNGLGSISVKEDILNNILINNPPSSITVKVLSTRGDTGFSCNAANPTLATLRGGLKLWGTTLHSISVQGSPAPPPLTGLTETEFARSELSLGELAKLTTYCRFIQILGSQITGICKACRSGALGGAIK